MVKKSTAHGKTQRTKIPAEQMDLPVTFDAAGNLVTLRQVMKPGHGSVLSLASLSPERRAELTVKRIEAQSTFEVAMVGGGIVDKERALEEVKAQTDIGRVLTEIEQRVVQNLLEAPLPPSGA
jgi:heptaprenylglyceryl phosphate synthase